MGPAPATRSNHAAASGHEAIGLKGMPILFVVLIIAAVLVGPGIWVRRVMARYAEPEDLYSFSGGDAARRLLDEAGLASVVVETTDKGDHYDPSAKAVRLSEDNFQHGSLTAVTIAAHEVGHAIQDAERYGPLVWRTAMVRWVGPIERLGAGLMFAAPVLTAITRAPGVGLVTLLGGFLVLATSIAVHAVTLPTEFDASFNRALPMLEDKRMLHNGDEPHARTLLRAAAMTYVAASLMSLLNIARWWAILRR